MKTNRKFVINLNPEWILLLLYSLLIAFTLFFTACSPVKRVLRDPKKLEIVGREWEKKNPCVTDSLTIVTKGETVYLTDSTQYLQYIRYRDSIIWTLTNGPNADSNIIYLRKKYSKIIDSLKSHPKTIFKTITVRDTIKTTVRDLRREGIFMDSIAYHRGVASFATGQKDAALIALRKAKTRNTIQLITFIVLLLGTHVLRSYFKIPFLK